MRYHLKQEFQKSMDSLRFSESTKEDMTNMLIQEMQKQNAPRRRNGRKLLMLSLAAATLLVTLTGAAVFTHWSRTAQYQYNPSQEIKEQAEKTGLSVMLEKPAQETNPSEVLSAADQGITVTAVQTIIDDHRGEITFRIEGFEFPEEKQPWAWSELTIDGDPNFYTSMTWGFFDGTTYNENNEWVYAATGKPVESDASGTAIMDWAAPDGSMEFTYYFSLLDDFGGIDGKELVAKFTAFGIHPGKGEGDAIELVEGNWELRWPLSSSSEKITTAPNAEIGTSGVKLLDAEIGQKTIRTTYQLKAYFKGFDVLEPFPQALTGVRMKDGAEYRCHSTSEGYADVDKLIFTVESSMYDAILDPSQAESLMFLENGPTSEPSPTYIYIPVS